MILDEDAIQLALTSVAAGFASFHDWETHNEVDDEHVGFTLWGEYCPNDEDNATTYFVTFTLGDAGWQGYLTIGQHSYYWASASEGDAYLVSTEVYGTINETISALKASVVELVTHLTRDINPP